MGVAPQTVRLGGQRVAVPTLAGPVGRPDAHYPGMNAATAIRQVDEQLRLIAELRNRAAAPHPGPAPERLAMARAVSDWRRDRVAAIAGFQRAANVRSTAELRDSVVLPGGETWRALFTYGSIARELDTMRDRQQGASDQVHTGLFNHQRFATEITARMRADAVARAHFHEGSLADFDTLLSFMERDTRIVDIRWMAYMLATAHHETAHIVSVQAAAVAGRPARRVRQWRTMAPVEETGHGRGRRYHPTVKVERLTATTARITEQDGDRFEVDERGSRALNRGAEMGATDGVAAVQTYNQAAGDELAYYGRGYVQLTWWSNYAAAGVALGRNLDLLFDPDLVMEPAIAYAVMSHGMLTGFGFANGHTLQRYIYGAACDYVGARRMVNGQDRAQDIANLARIFEAALTAAKL